MAVGFLFGFAFGRCAVEEHDVFADAIFFSKIEDVSGSESALSPGPIFLAKGKEAVVGPVVEVFGAFDAHAILW